MIKHKLHANDSCTVGLFGGPEVC